MKILIGCPTCERYEYCVDLWIKRVKEIIEYSKKFGIYVDYLLVDNSKEDFFFDKLRKKNINVKKSPYFENVKERIVFSRNILRDKAINENYDYFLSLEQDMIPEKDIIKRLLNHNKEIVSAYYGKEYIFKIRDNETGEIKEIEAEVPVIYISENEDEKGKNNYSNENPNTLESEAIIRNANPNEVLFKGLIKVGSFGVGCLLIKKEVLAKIKFRFESEKKAFDDMFFCKDSKLLGYELFLDSDIRVEHLHKPWDNINI